MLLGWVPEITSLINSTYKTKNNFSYRSLAALINIPTTIDCTANLDIVLEELALEHLIDHLHCGSLDFKTNHIRAITFFSLSTIKGLRCLSSYKAVYSSNSTFKGKSLFVIKKKKLSLVGFFAIVAEKASGEVLKVNAYKFTRDTELF